MYPVSRKKGGRSINSIIKLCGICLVMAGSLGMGYYQVQKDRMRVSFLEEFERNLTFLYGEMQFSGEEIQHLFEKLGQSNGLLSTFWQRVNILLEEQYDVTLSGCIKQAVTEMETKNYVKAEELQILLGLGENIGSLDLETQLHTLKHYQKQLEEVTVSAKKRYREKSRIHMVLGATAGTFLSIVLL